MTVCAGIQRRAAFLTRDWNNCGRKTHHFRQIAVLAFIAVFIKVSCTGFTKNYGATRPCVSCAKTLCSPVKCNRVMRRSKIMEKPKIFTMPFASVYPFYVHKAEKKGRAKAEVDEIICWLTGYGRTALQKQINANNDFETFFAQSPQINPNASKITGVICGCRVEEIEDELMRNIRYLDKLVDELAKGKPMEKILRT
jgi:hypothetical protein